MENMVEAVYDIVYGKFLFLKKPGDKIHFKQDCLCLRENKWFQILLECNGNGILVVVTVGYLQACLYLY